MNLILIDSSEIVRGRVELGGRRARHIASVLAPALGDELRVGVIRGGVGHATVEAVARERVVLALDISAVLAATPRVDLILAMPRPKVLSRVLASAAALGVRRIDLVNAWRVDKSYLGSRRLDGDRLRADLVRGCEQGATTWVPDIAVHRLLMPFLAELEVDVDERQPHALLAHPRAGQAIESVLQSGFTGSVVVAIGPEGGWIDREIASFTAIGFTPVGVGAAILCVDDAIVATLAEIDLLRRLPSSS
jgi:16S rRNA (uracil1498-N3)-methyltransferase